MLVNGKPIASALGGGDASDEKEQSDKPRRYTLDIRTEGGRQMVAADGKDRLTISAQVTCDDPEADTAALTASISFSLEGPDAAWAKLDAAHSGSARAVALSARPPSEGAHLTESRVTVRVSVQLEGGLAQGPVEIALLPELELEFS